MERQPLVRPVPLMILLLVGTMLVASSIPVIFEPRSPQKDRQREFTNLWFLPEITRKIVHLPGGYIERFFKHGGGILS